MRNFLKAAGFAFALTGMFVACESDPCVEVICGNGFCTDGTCACDAGYEKDTEGACNVEVRTKMLGTYTVTETCGAASPTAFVSLVGSSTNVTDITISNFFDSFANPVVGAVAGDAITIASQQPDPADAAGIYFTVEGSGTFSKGATAADDTIDMTYTVTQKDATGIIATATCTASFAR